MIEPLSDTAKLREASAAHNWRHFGDMTDGAAEQLRVIVRGEGCHLYDSDGNRFLDALSNLFCVNVGYSYGDEFAEVAAEQLRTLGYHANWASTHPRAIELSARVAELAGDLDLPHVMFTPSGGEGVETCWKIARQYFKLKGENRWKAIARETAYHGVSLGAISLNGIAAYREPFEPLVPGALHVRNTKAYGRPEGETEAEHAAFLLEDMEARILQEGPSTVAMIIVEPVQNAGGMLTPPAGYAEGLRALADKYGILLVADETITGYGRLGTWFGSQRIGLRPDILTSAKALSSAHAVIGAVLVSDRVYEPFTEAPSLFKHGNTFGAHPVMSAIALKNLEIMERLRLNEHVLAKEPELRAALESLYDLDCVGDVRGMGFFYAIELKPGTVSDGALLAKEIENGLSDAGIMLRVTPTPTGAILGICPPLVADTAEFDELVGGIRTVLSAVCG
ncbi:aminotransferase class III-fold pyridoxal phosphate-dependent enzyme [Nocardioides sp. Kera G14]|uniref:aminotransferase class III-fold pyridoxal phosphate-dependent enzyme n=1 Tax=Nocardioides sp. Kera G14 TaxID=2884264 RepID=UPI001D11C31D|nr:aminotransferase class III-fold pyridoxal phosphate-dependent enzyme [Nocardioides sp. Kera G14]UDY24038.1 aminotransferase class III-fold pyridoxal phosphate-dependent enzyme [Nocardioides sp. Kera G14]